MDGPITKALAALHSPNADEEAVLESVACAKDWPTTPFIFLTTC